MARRKVKLKGVEGSGLLSERCAFDICTLIYKFYETHPDVYKDFLAWKAANDAAALEAAAQG